MALSQYWVSKNRKDLAERAIVSRRQAEALSAQRRESAARYHRDLNLLSSQYRNIEEGLPSKTPRVNQESFIEEEARAKRKEKLQQRQQKLMLLFARENEIYLRELEKITQEEHQKNPWNIQALKEQIEELRRRRKHDEEVLAKKSMAHLYHMNDIIFIDKKKTDALDKEVKEAFEKKKQEIAQKTAEQIKEAKNQQVAMEKQREEALRQAEEAGKAMEESKKKLEAYVKDSCTNSGEMMSEFHQAKLHIELLENHQKLLESLIKKRSDFKEIQNQRKKRIEMFRRSKEKVRKMAAEVRHLLEIDLGTLNFLSQVENTDKELCRVLDFQVVKTAQETVKQMLAQEDARDSEMQILFEEEAVKMMDKRQKAWEQEMNNHEKNISNVFETLDKEIKGKIRECEEKQKQISGLVDSTINIVEDKKEEFQREEQELLAKQQYFMNKAQQLENQIKKLVAEMPPARPKK